MQIEDTSKRDPLLHLAGAMGHREADQDLSGYITGMEAEGQRQLVNSADLPTDTHGTDDAFIALGFTFGEPHAGDPLFRPATLPEGWSKQGSDHAMHSYVVDDKGRRRVNIFYKAAFYDRRADMGILHPANRLSDIYYADDEPAALPIDDLTSAEEARRWIADMRERDLEYRAKYSHGCSDGVRELDARLARLDAMAALLPSES